MFKKAVLLGLLGYIAGCIIGLCFALGNKGAVFPDALPDILLGGIPGAIAMGSAVIYDIEEWSLFRATATHFLVVMGVILLACFVLKWFEPWSMAFWIMLMMEAVAYFIVWLILFLHYRTTVHKLNELLENSLSETDKTDKTGRKHPN